MGCPPASTIAFPVQSLAFHTPSTRARRLAAQRHARLGVGRMRPSLDYSRWRPHRCASCPFLSESLGSLLPRCSAQMEAESQYTLHRSILPERRSRHVQSLSKSNNDCAATAGVR